MNLIKEKIKEIKLKSLQNKIEKQGIDDDILRQILNLDIDVVAKVKLLTTDSYSKLSYLDTINNLNAEELTKITKSDFSEEVKNVILLNNDKVELDDSFTIYGFSHQVKYYLASTKEKIDLNYIEERIGKIDINKFNLLISHDPLLYNLYSEYGFDMVLSGHLHGGIINIPFVGGLLSPDFTFFPKYYKGVNKIGNTNLVISRGLGYGYMIPIRVFNRGEVVIINLMKNE